MLKKLLFVVIAYTLSVLQVSASDIDLSKAVVIGNGPQKVIEFTDPDCPYCRKAAKYFDARKDLTRFVFFYPLPRHPKAKEKAQYILSQLNRHQAYSDVMSGKMDNEAQFQATQAGIKLQQEQFLIARKAKVDSTPTFMINGRIIEGFDLKKIEDAIGK